MKPAQLPLPLPEPHFGPWPGPRTAPGAPPAPDPFNPSPFDFAASPVEPAREDRRVGDWLDRWLGGEVDLQGRKR